MVDSIVEHSLSVLQIVLACIRPAVKTSSVSFFSHYLPVAMATNRYYNHHPLLLLLLLQIVWKGTKSVGCAYSCQIYVCQFEPPGNVIGYFAQNVGRKKKG